MSREAHINAIISFSLRNGIIATAALLAVYGGVVSGVSGVTFARAQVVQFWPYIVSLAVGFGIQVGLYSYLKQATGVHAHTRTMVAASGVTSTVAMVSCCAHYLVNLLPLLAATGLATLVSQYQVQFFWLGLAMNLIGILYMGRHIMRIMRQV
ncbi:MAG: hypothetical protein HY459_04125 [Parcubacteria group bacterium]|nr:hypothetical protein [Parcubacteria group bacterium]